jgi:hypothetical protein
MHYALCIIIALRTVHCELCIVAKVLVFITTANSAPASIAWAWRWRCIEIEDGDPPGSSRRRRSVAELTMTQQRSCARHSVFDRWGTRHRVCVCARSIIPAMGGLGLFSRYRRRTRRRQFNQSPADQSPVIDLAIEIEGHPDNVAPACWAAWSS